jgi:hypothetical protein
MNDVKLTRIRDLIQEDIGNRGLRTDPAANLIGACAGDFAGACRSLAETPEPVVAVVTGFFIPQAEPPSGETDGPLGAIFLARALVPLGFKVGLVSDAFCERALQLGLEACGLAKDVPLLTLPRDPSATELSLPDLPPLTHLVAIERVGPSHTTQSLGQQPGSAPEDVAEFAREVPAAKHDRCYTMKGRDITAVMSPAHLLFERAGRQTPRPVTIGIGDGGNEIGMGKIPWRILRRNIPNGGQVACRIATDYLIVAGISNWGGYGLAAGVRLLRDAAPDRDLFDPERERAILKTMVESGPLVDGVMGKPAVSVDGIDYNRYSRLLNELAETTD